MGDDIIQNNSVSFAYKIDGVLYKKISMTIDRVMRRFTVDIKGKIVLNQISNLQCGIDSDQTYCFKSKTYFGKNKELMKINKRADKYSEHIDNKRENNLSCLGSLRIDNG